MLTKKQNTDNHDWIQTINNIESIISKEYIQHKIDITVDEIKNKTKGKNAAYSWSGGKDSLVLQYVCEWAGINKCVFVCCDLEYKLFMDWVLTHKPQGCTIINTGQNLMWLSEHTDMLFPQDSKTAAKWFKIVQHRGQEKYFKDNNLDILILGRRRADGNYVGKNSNIYTNKSGITRYSPIADWTHEEILACIHYYNIPIPPIYDWKNGYLCGTHNFAARQWTGSINNGWNEVFEIEPEIVFQASKYIESAKEFLDGQTEKNIN